MDIPSYLLGKKKGGGGTTSLQNKTVEITENGITTVSADAGYDGLRNVEIDTDVQPTLQTKSQTITTNTTTTITADNDYDGLSSVEITTNIPQPSGEISITENGSYNVSDYASANVNVSGSSADDDSDLINFYDYDGTLVDSVRLSELPLQALPTPPAHEGLTFEKWNWTLADVNALTYPMDVGALYTTTSGATELYFENIGVCRLNLYLYLTQSNNITIDWGDGSSNDYSTPTHTYETRGNYVVKIYCNSSGWFQLRGVKSSNSAISSFITNTNTTDEYAENAYHLKEIRLGAKCYGFKGSACYGLKYLKKISLHSHVGMEYSSGSPSITSYIAFQNCYSLKYIVLPPYQNYIPAGVFNNCYCLKGISFPKTFISTLNYCFTNDYNIKRVCIPTDCTQFYLQGLYCLNSVYYDTSDNSKNILKNITIADTNTPIPISVKNLKKNINLKYSLLSGNQDIISLSDSKYSFITNSTAESAFSSFSDCYALENANNFSTYVPNITSIESLCKHCYNLKTITLPNTITTFSTNNFLDCYNLETINIPSNLTTLGDYSFQNCYSLTSINLPSTLSSLGTYCFQNCYNIEEINTLGNITIIPTGCFQYCNGLTEITLPSSITSINGGAFYNCFGMIKYDFTNLTAVPTLSNVSAFTGINANCKIVVPDDLYETWIGTTNWSTYADYIVKESEYND